jgi:hypothetical protein
MCRRFLDTLGVLLESKPYIQQPQDTVCKPGRTWRLETMIDKLALVGSPSDTLSSDAPSAQLKIRHDHP